MGWEKTYNILILLLYMRIFKFFKKKKISKEESVKMITRNNLNDWFQERKKYYLEKDKEFLLPIKERIARLCRDLESEIMVLLNLDFKKNKEIPKVEAIVKENVKNYIKSIEKLIERLSTIDERKGLIEKINFAVDEFNKKTDIAYQKIEFIFEKEIHVSKEHIRIFLKDLEKILKNNSKELEEFRIMELVEDNILKIQDIKKIKLKFIKIINEDILKSKKFKENLILKEKEISKILQSDKFLKEESRKKKLELKKNKLDREISNLKGEINFKSLTSFYHQFVKEMELIKEYKSNFKQAFEKSGKDNLIQLLSGVSLDSLEIMSLIKKIEILEKEIKEFTIKDFNIDYLKQNVYTIKSSINSVESEILVKKKKLNHLDKNLDEVFLKLAEILKEIHVKVE